MNLLFKTTAYAAACMAYEFASAFALNMICEVPGNFEQGKYAVSLDNELKSARVQAFCKNDEACAQVYELPCYKGIDTRGVVLDNVTVCATCKDISTLKTCLFVLRQDKTLTFLTQVPAGEGLIYECNSIQ